MTESSLGEEAGRRLSRDDLDVDVPDSAIGPGQRPDQPRPGVDGAYPWGDPDLQGERTAEGEYGVPFDRPAQFGTRQFLTDEEYAKRLEGANAPIPHWREYNTTSRRTALVIDPPNGRLPPRTPTARPVPVHCGSLACGEPRDSYEDYGLGVRCIVHGGGFPDVMFPALYRGPTSTGFTGPGGAIASTRGPRRRRRSRRAP